MRGIIDQIRKGGFLSIGFIVVIFVVLVGALGYRYALNSNAELASDQPPSSTQSPSSTDPKVATINSVQDLESLENELHEIESNHDAARMLDEIERDISSL